MPREVAAAFDCSLLVLWGFAFLFPLSPIITSALAVLYLVMMPLSLGQVVGSRVLNRLPSIGCKLAEISQSFVLVRWTLGFLVATAAAFSLLLVGLFSAIILGSVFLLVPILLRWIPRGLPVSHVDPRLIFRGIPIVLLGASVAAYIRILSPFPLQPGIDVFTHLYVVNTLISHSSMGSSPLVYIPSVDILIALASATFHAPGLGVFWMGPFVLVPVFALSTFLMIERLTGNLPAAFVGSLVGILITEQGLVSNLQFLYPSSVVMVLFPLFVVLAYEVAVKESQSLKVAVPSLLLVGCTLLVIHLQLGTVALVMCSMYIVGTRLATRYPEAVRSLVLPMIVLVSLYYFGLFTRQIVIDIPGLGYMYPVPTDINLLKSWYTNYVMILAILGMVVVAFGRKSGITLSLLTSVSLLTFFQQISQVQRMMTLVQPLIAMMAAVVITLPVLIFVSGDIHPKIGAILGVGRLTFGADKMTRISRASRVGAAFLVLFLMVGLFPALLQPYQLYFNGYTSRGYDFTNVTPAELSAGDWIKANSPPNAVIYSDPATVLIMRGLGDRTNVPAVAENQTVGMLIRSSLMSQNPVLAHNTILSLAGQGALIVISPRTATWLTVWQTDYMLQWPVNNGTLFNGLSKFNDTSYFSLLYHNDGIYVFALASH